MALARSSHGAAGRHDGRNNKPPDPIGDAENTYDIPQGGAISRELRRWFLRQKKHVLGKLFAGAHRLAPVPLVVPSLTDWNDPMARAFTPLISVEWSRSGRDTTARLGLDPETFDVTSPHLRGAIESAALKFCRATNATTSGRIGSAIERLRRELAEGMVDAGESDRELAKRVRAVFTEASESRADRIAKTESSRAYHAAQEAAAQESGVVAGLELLLSGDACPLCRMVATEAKRVRLGTPFAVIGNNPDYSTVKYPPIHPRCQCTVIEVLTPEHGGPAEPGFRPTLIQPKPGATYEAPEGRPEAVPEPGRERPTHRPRPSYDGPDQTDGGPGPELRPGKALELPENVPIAAPDTRPSYDGPDQADGGMGPRPRPGKPLELPPNVPLAAPALPPDLDHDHLKSIDLHAAGMPWENPSFKRSYGGVVFDEQGRVLLREPAGHFGGYVWTFPKGGNDPGEHPVDAGLREVWEETGVKGQILGLVPGGFAGSTSSKAYMFVMRAKSTDLNHPTPETASQKWVTYDEAKALLSLTTTAAGKKRDLDILDAAYAEMAKLKAGQYPPGIKPPTAEEIAAKQAAELAAKLKAAQDAAKEAESAAGVKAFKDQVKAADKAKAEAEKAAKAAAKAAELAAKQAAKDAKAAAKAEKAAAKSLGGKPPKGWPGSPDGLIFVKRLGGSTGAELVEDPATGKRYVRKRGANPDHLREECFADAAYQALGAKVPAFHLYDGPGGPTKLSAFLDGAVPLGELERTDPKAFAAACKKLQKHFAVDALMGNWDVVGMSGDNVLVDPKGEPWRVDNGGSLRFRAQGAKKTADEWNAYPVELWTLRDARKNAQTAKVFKGVKFGDLAAQIRAMQGRALTLPPEVGRVVGDRLAQLADVADVAETFAADEWHDGYIDEFAKHKIGIRAAGIAAKMPTEMKRQGSVTPVDQDGKPWDHLRGSGSLVYNLKAYVEANGGNYDTVDSYCSAQGGSSWSGRAAAFKYFVATHREPTVGTAYYWKKSPAEAKKELEKAQREAGGAEKYAASMAAFHAFTTEYLTKAQFPGKSPDGKTVRLRRTEDRAVLAKYNVKKGETATIHRGAAESFSLWEWYSLHGSERTFQDVPIHRIFGTYWQDRNPGAGHGCFLGDHENEFVALTEGIPMEYQS